jgi:hypothetical protein
LDVLHEMFKLWPEVAMSYESLFRASCLLELLGEPQQAADRFAWLSIAAEGHREGEMALLKLGRVQLDKLGSPESAIPPLEKLLAANPDSRWADAAQRILERAKKGLGGRG